MNITIIHGSNRHGRTYNIAKLFIEHLKTEQSQIKEFFLPRDMSSFCIGCTNCFAKGEAFCPHYEQVEPIRLAIEKADIVVFTTPVYVLRASGQMKTLLDHFGFQFMVHRPNQTMFSKIAVIFSTTAGAGTKGAMKDISTSLKFWGIAKIYKFGIAVAASEWHGVKEAKKILIEKKVSILAKRVKKIVGKVKPGLITKILFYAHRLFHIKWGVCDTDIRYWQDKGWLGKNRPY